MAKKTARKKRAVKKSTARSNVDKLKGGDLTIVAMALDSVLNEIDSLKEDIVGIQSYVDGKLTRLAEDLELLTDEINSSDTDTEDLDERMEEIAREVISQASVYIEAS